MASKKQFKYFISNEFGAWDEICEQDALCPRYQNNARIPFRPCRYPRIVIQMEPYRPLPDVYPKTRYARKRLRDHTICEFICA